MSVHNGDLPRNIVKASTPLVSIIIAAYNAAPYIERALASAKYQTLEDIEIIVIDDGSFDNTAEVAERYSLEDSRFRVIRLRVNSGVSCARNVGLNNAKGEWVAILDADDSFLPDRLERLVTVAEERACDLVIDNLTLVFPLESERRLAFAENRMSNPDPISVDLFVDYDRPRLGLNAAGFSKPLIRRAFIERVDLRYTDEITIGEDFHFYVQALLRGADMRFTEYSGYIYNVTLGSLSRLDLGKVRRAINQSSEMLISESEKDGNVAAVKALRRREADIDAANDLTDFLERLRRRQFASAGLAFLRSRVKAGILYRLAAKIRYDLLVKVGVKFRSK